MLAFIFGLNRRQLPQQQQPKMRGEKMTKEDWREREKKIERSKLNQSRKISIKAERQEKCKLEKAMIQERLEPFPSHKGNTDKYMYMKRKCNYKHWSLGLWKNGLISIIFEIIEGKEAMLLFPAHSNCGQ